MAGLLASVAVGDVTPEEGNVVASLIEKHARIREISDFEARLKALEERFGHGESRRATPSAPKLSIDPRPTAGGVPLLSGR
jgi:hypothetical protein